MRLLITWGIILVTYVGITALFSANKLNKQWDAEEEENPFNGNN